MIEIEVMIKEKRANCTGCYGCYNACPVRAITMVEDEEGFRYPIINHEKCVGCGICGRACPVLNKPAVEQTGIPETYAAINEDDEIRMKSSSGGIFHLLARDVLLDDGIVFGAGFDDNWEVSHQAAETEEQLANLRVSKYLQSRAEDVYMRVQQELKNGRKVLFSGTPCQGAALRSFLRNAYPNLLVVDFICHGVPSPAVWRRYLAWRTEGEIIESISFRNKNLSWERFLLAIFCENANKYLSADLRHDLYLKGFLQNLYLRPSCHECLFRKQNRLTDITLADFWGVKNVVPEMYDGKGTSLVIIHSQRGRDVFEGLHVRKMQVPFADAVKYNSAMLKPCLPSDKRELFYREFINGNSDINVLLERFTRLPIRRRMKNILKRIVSAVRLSF